MEPSWVESFQQSDITAAVHQAASSDLCWRIVLLRVSMEIRHHNAETLTHGIIRRNPRVINRTLMSRQLMQHLSFRAVPNCRRPISTTSRDPLARRIPACAIKILLQSCLRSIEDPNLPVFWCERSNIPCPHCAIMRHRQQKLRVRRHR